MLREMFHWIGVEDRNPQYSLYGIIVHSGSSQDSGHYYAYVKDSSGKWWRCDDSCTSIVNADTVLSERAYILFYARRNPRPASDVPNSCQSPSLPASRPSSDLNGDMLVKRPVNKKLPVNGILKPTRGPASLSAFSAQVTKTPVKTGDHRPTPGEDQVVPHVPSVSGSCISKASKFKSGIGSSVSHSIAQENGPQWAPRTFGNGAKAPWESAQVAVGGQPQTTVNDNCRSHQCEPVFSRGRRHLAEGLQAMPDRLGSDSGSACRDGVVLRLQPSNGAGGSEGAEQCVAWAQNGCKVSRKEEGSDLPVSSRRLEACHSMLATVPGVEECGLRDGGSREDRDGSQVCGPGSHHPMREKDCLLHPSVKAGTREGAGSAVLGGGTTRLKRGQSESETNQQKRLHTDNTVVPSYGERFTESVSPARGEVEEQCAMPVKESAAIPRLVADDLRFALERDAKQQLRRSPWCETLRQALRTARALHEGDELAVKDLPVMVIPGVYGLGSGRPKMLFQSPVPMIATVLCDKRGRPKYSGSGVPFICQSPVPDRQTIFIVRGNLWVF
ncbi:hypothetical protein CBR_g4440 [Chara braunii]|uniref:ubiquitinyl hydrolase 1 n=1 Tax=Chara braunii TaxID=69332 RepID=A0A388KHT8_CHABU|nr:hypothetical protein CBR_g4440 [Chara braunii]|eukprot:GBG69609.1 hypothetical protein CBR_g4440 [Chara braunii]